MTLSKAGVVVDGKKREIKMHGTPDFPIAFYDNDLSRATDTVYWHWHEELEALVVTEGSVIVDVGSDRATLNVGDGCFINSNVIHSMYKRGRGGGKWHSIVFQPRLIGGSLESIYWTKYIIPLITNDSFRLKIFNSNDDGRIIDHIRRAWDLGVDEPAGCELFIRNELSDLIFHVNNSIEAPKRAATIASRRDEERVKIMINFIHEHFNEELKIEMIAARAAIGVAECSRCFRRVLNITPSRYLRRIRIQKAAELLLSTDRMISDIAIDCGFSEMNYFCRVFRQIFAMTPTEYRRRASAGG